MNGRTITVTLKAEYANLRAGLGAGAAEVKSFGNDVREAALSTQQATDQLGRGFLIAGGIIAAGLGLATYGAIQLEESMRNVATISPYVQKNFDSVTASVMQMSNALPQSANELAQGLYDIASSGFAGADGLTVLRASATAASAGLSDTATSGRAITGVLNAYGLSAKDARNVSDVLFQTVNLGVVTFGELSQNIGDVIGLAAQMKIPIRDVGSAIATITLAGVPAAEATTSLNRVMQSLLIPSDALIEKFHTWGFASGSAALDALGLQGVMLRLRKEVGGNAAAFQAFFPDIRSLRGALALTAADGENYIRVQKGMEQAGGATGRALEQQSKAVGFQLQILKNQATNLAISFGQELLPAMRFVAGAAKTVVGEFSGMPGPVRTGIAILAALSAGMLLVGGSALLVGSRIGRMRTELASIGPSGERAVGAITGLARGISLASGAALAAYGFTALDGTLEGTVTGVLSLVSAVALLRPGLSGLQGLLSNLSTALTAKSGLANAGVAVGSLAQGVGRLSAAAPILAVSGAVMASTMDDMGKASIGGAVNMASMAVTGAELGTVVMPGIGTAVGAVAGAIAGPLMSALGVGGESVDDYRSRFEKLADTLDSLGPKLALQQFLKSLGNDDAWSLIKGNIRAIDDEIRAVAKNSPDAALKVVDALKKSSFGAQFTARDYAHLNSVIEGQVEANAKADASREKSKASNEAIRKAHAEVSAAAGQMSEAEQQAAEAAQKALEQIATAATQNLPTAKTAFEQTQQAAADFGVQMDPNILLQGFQEKLKAQLSFGANISTIMQAGFSEIGDVVAQEGPEKGGQIAQALADGIKSGDPTIVQQLNDTAKLLGVVAPVLEDQFKTTWGPAIQRGQAEAFANLSPVVRQMFGLDVPTAIADQAPANTSAAEQVAAAAAFGYVDGVKGIPGSAEAAAAAASYGFVNGRPLNVTAGGIVGAGAMAGFAEGIGGIGGVAEGSGQQAADALGSTAPATGAAGTQSAQTGVSGFAAGIDPLTGIARSAGDSATAQFGEGLAPLPGLTGPAIALAAVGIIQGALPLAATAYGAGAGVGASFAAGIASGIASNSAGVEAAAAQIVSDAEAAARKRADSHSPSRLFARVGHDIARGMATGIRAGTGDVARATGDLISVASMTRPISRPSAGFSDMARGAGGSSVQVFSPITIGGNLYGDQHLARTMRAAADERDRKLANDLRRRRN